MTSHLPDDCDKQVVGHGQPGKKTSFLISTGKSHGGPGAGGCGAHIGAADLDGALGWGEVTRHDVEECRLPGPVGAEDAETLALRDVEIDATQGDHASEGHLDSPEPENRSGG